MWRNNSHIPLLRRWKQQPSLNQLTSGHIETAWDIQAHSSPGKQSTRVLILCANERRECFRLIISCVSIYSRVLLLSTEGTTNFWILLKSRNEFFRWGSTQTNCFLIKRRSLVDLLHPLPLSLIISALISGSVATLHDSSIIRDQSWRLWILIMVGRCKGGRNWCPSDNFHLPVWIGSSPTQLFKRDKQAQLMDAQVSPLSLTVVWF